MVSNATEIEQSSKEIHPSQQRDGDGSRIRTERLRNAEVSELHIAYEDGSNG